MRRMNTLPESNEEQTEFDFVSEVTVATPTRKACRASKSFFKKDTLAKVKDFHDACGVFTPEIPYLEDQALNELRYNLLAEELQELKDGMNAKDPVAVLDALVDLQYVLDGAFLSLGFADYKDIGFDEVQRSNMSKLGEDGKPILREDGKIMKGPNYFPPDLHSVIHGD